MQQKEEKIECDPRLLGTLVTKFIGNVMETARHQGMERRRGGATLPALKLPSQVLDNRMISVGKKILQESSPQQNFQRCQSYGLP